MESKKQKKLLVMIEPSKPFSEMTDEEIDQYAEEAVAQAQKNFNK